jgi:hypothetical protein
MKRTAKCERKHDEISKGKEKKERSSKNLYNKTSEKLTISWIIALGIIRAK